MSRRDLPIDPEIFVEGASALDQWTAIKGKPFITVSSKGIVNGLSTVLNDGADFGPDTTKGATAPGQYGGTYTQTVGMQEWINYSVINHKKGIALPGIYKFNSDLSFTEITDYTASDTAFTVYSLLTVPLNSTTTYDTALDISGAIEVPVGAIGNGISMGSDFPYSIIDISAISPITGNVSQWLLYMGWKDGQYYSGGASNFIIWESAPVNISGISINGQSGKSDNLFVGPIPSQQNIYSGTPSSNSQQVAFALSGFWGNNYEAGALVAVQCYAGLQPGAHLTVKSLNVQSCSIGINMYMPANEGIDHDATILRYICQAVGYPLNSPYTSSNPAPSTTTLTIVSWNEEDWESRSGLPSEWATTYEVNDPTTNIQYVVLKTQIGRTSSSRIPAPMLSPGANYGFSNIFYWSWDYYNNPIGNTDIWVNTLNPAYSTTSTSEVYSGSGITLKMLSSGIVEYEVIINVWNDTAGDECFANMHAGTGTPPSQGTVVGSPINPYRANFNHTFTSAIANATGQLTLKGVFTGLTVGTTYWFDAGIAANLGGTAYFYEATFHIKEVVI